METRGQEINKIEDTFRSLLREHIEKHDRDIQEVSVNRANIWRR